MHFFPPRDERSVTGCPPCALALNFDLSPPELQVWLVATSEMLVAAVLLVCAAAACAADPSNIVIVADQASGHGALMIAYPTIT
jgi:acetyl esterase/lipase